MADYTLALVYKVRKADSQEKDKCTGSGDTTSLGWSWTLIISPPHSQPENGGWRSIGREIVFCNPALTCHVEKKTDLICAIYILCTIDIHIVPQQEKIFLYI